VTRPVTRSVNSEVIAQLETLVDRYSLFLFDQFGVLHDGHESYAGMCDTLREMKSAGCQLGIITNSGKRADFNIARLERFGFTPELFSVVMSSGEAAHVEMHIDGGARLAGVLPGEVRLLVVGRGQDEAFVDSLPVEESDNARDCNLVLISGSRPETQTLDDYREHLAPAAKRGVPAICTNPDRCLLLGNAKTGFGSGVVAEAYASLGGPVTWIGKPHAAIYRYALDAAGVSPAETVCIGDSIEHDVAGAHAAGCDAVLVRTGVHAGATGDELEALFTRYGERPRWVLER